MAVSSEPGPVTLGPRIGLGRTADIHAWEAGTVLKLFHDWMDPGAINYELRIAQAVSSAGIACPTVYGEVQINGRRGIVYERFDGPSMLTCLQRSPLRLRRYTHQLVDMQVALHRAHLPAGTPPDVLPAWHDRARWQIEHATVLPNRFRTAALAALETLPQHEATICHGDLHPDNILIPAADPGRAVIIDWTNAALGNPIADVTRTLLLLTTGEPVEKDSMPHWMLFLAHHFMARFYLNRYAAQSGYSRTELNRQIARWRVPVIAARFSEGITAEHPVLLAQLEKLLPDVQ